MNDSILNILIFFVFASWLLLSTLNQFRNIKWINPIKKYDYCSIIPSWSFFAPNPGTSDTELLYRDKYVDGEFSEWRSCLNSIFNPFRLIWNPNKRQRKAIVDMCSNLHLFAIKVNGENDILMYIPYISLLNFVSHLPKTKFIEFRQFMLVKKSGFNYSEKYEVIFISNFHKL